MGILEARGPVPREEGETKGHTICRLPIVHTMHTPPVPDHPVMAFSRVWASLPVSLHSLLFATEPRNSSMSEHFCQMLTGRRHRVIFLLRKFANM